MIKIILIIFVVLAAAVAIYASTRPDTLHVERRTSVKAPAAAIFPLINDFHNWASWSPYEKKDPAMKRTFSGTPAGVGSVYEWDGDRNVGKGRMEITGATPSKVTIK